MGLYNKLLCLIEMKIYISSQINLKHALLPRDGEVVIGGTVVTKLIQYKKSDKKIMKKEKKEVSSFREFKDLKKERKFLNFSKKMIKIKSKIERRGEIFSREKYMEERGKKREEEDRKKVEEEKVKIEEMIVARSKDKEEEEERKSKKVPYSSLEDKDKQMNSFLLKKNSRSVEAFQLECFEHQIKMLRKKNLL